GDGLPFSGGRNGFRRPTGERAGFPPGGPRLPGPVPARSRRRRRDSPNRKPPNRRYPPDRSSPNRQPPGGRSPGGKPPAGPGGAQAALAPEPEKPAARQMGQAPPERTGSKKAAAGRFRVRRTDLIPRPCPDRRRGTENTG